MVDEAVVDACYRASQAGVPVDIWVRGICAIRPGVPGLSENVRVRSILGRFLEHSRVFAFGNGGEPEVWIGSADMMHRNLDRRIEALVRVTDPAHRAALNRLLETGMSDTTASWHLGPDGEWTRHSTDADGQPLRNIQEMLIDARRRRVAQRHPDPADVLARHLRARATEFLRALRLNRGAATPEDSAEAARALRRAARRISAGLYTFQPALDPAWSQRLGPELAWVSGTLSQEDACTTRLTRLQDALHHLSGPAAPTPPRPAGQCPALPVCPFPPTPPRRRRPGPRPPCPAPRPPPARPGPSPPHPAAPPPRPPPFRPRTAGAPSHRVPKADPAPPPAAFPWPWAPPKPPLSWSGSSPSPGRGRTPPRCRRSGPRGSTPSPIRWPCWPVRCRWRAGPRISSCGRSPRPRGSGSWTPWPRCRWSPRGVRTTRRRWCTACHPTRPAPAGRPWHQVRLLLRLHRYAQEVLDPAAGGDPRLRAAGEALDRHRDAAEAAAAAQAARTPRIAPATAYALGVLHAGQRHEVEAARYAFQRAWQQPHADTT